MKGWPKGKPRKPVQQPKTEVAFNESVSPAGQMGDNTDFSPDERMTVYQDATKQLYPDMVTETPTDNEGNKEPELPKEVITEAKAEEKPPEEETVTTTEKVEPVQATDKKPEDVRTVPYGALHEERMKRKDLQREKEELDARLKQLMEDNVKLMTKGKEPSADEYEPVYKGELTELRDKNLRLESEVNTIKQRFQSEDQRRDQIEAKKLIDKVDEEETKAGRPGFSKIGWRLVLEEIEAMQGVDPVMAQSYRNPDGWKLIHAKKFPEAQAIYVAHAKQELFDQKKQAKTGAELVTNTGKAPVKEAPEKEWKWDDYLKMRQNVNL